MHPSKPIRFFQRKKKRLEPKGSRRLCLFVLPALEPDAVIVTRANRGQTIAVDRQGIPLATAQRVTKRYAVVVPQMHERPARPVFAACRSHVRACAARSGEIQNSAHRANLPHADAILLGKSEQKTALPDASHARKAQRAWTLPKRDPLLAQPLLYRYKGRQRRWLSIRQYSTTKAPCSSR